MLGQIITSNYNVRKSKQIKSDWRVNNWNVSKPAPSFNSLVIIVSRTQIWWLKLQWKLPNWWPVFYGKKKCNQAFNFDFGPTQSSQTMAICSFSLHQGKTESQKNLEQRLILRISILNLNVINECFSFNQSTFLLYMYYVHTNSIAPSFYIWSTHNQLSLHSLWQRVCTVLYKTSGPGCSKLG